MVKIHVTSMKLCIIFCYLVPEYACSFKYYYALLCSGGKVKGIMLEVIMCQALAHVCTYMYRYIIPACMYLLNHTN